MVASSSSPLHTRGRALTDAANIGLHHRNGSSSSSAGFLEVEQQHRIDSTSPTSYSVNDFSKVFHQSQNAPPDTRDVVIIVHGARHLPGQEPTAFVTAKTYQEAQEKQPAKSATHAAESSK